MKICMSEIESADQKLIQQYRNGVTTTEEEHPGEKVDPQVQNIVHQYRSGVHSTEVAPPVQKLIPQYRN